MPDADGKIRGISVPADAWERIFGSEMLPHDHDWPCEHFFVPSRSVTAHTVHCKHCGEVRYDTLPSPGWRYA